MLSASMEPWKAAVRIDDRLAKSSTVILYLLLKYIGLEIYS